VKYEGRDHVMRRDSFKLLFIPLFGSGVVRFSPEPGFTCTMSVSDNVDPIVASALASIDCLSPSDIPNLDDFCPICLITFRAVFEPREDSPQGKAVSGVARVGGCGHLFCVEDLSEWIKGRHGTCPTCRHDFFPELRPLDSDAESDDDGDYVPTEYEADSDYNTEDEYGPFRDSDTLDGMDMDTHPFLSGDDEAIEEDERELMASLRYHESHDLEERSICDREAGGWESDDDEPNEWLRDGDSRCMCARFIEANLQAGLDSDEGDYAMSEDGEEPKC